jgi:formate/nitrite transporter FocA (FNT family)
VFLGNLIGSVFYAVLLYCALTMSGSVPPEGISAKIIALAEAKVAYAKFGGAGMLTCFVKAMLCNWMVTLGVVMAMTSHSTLGQIVAAWLPVFIFFAQGFEHSVVNMFVIPLGMLLGAKVSFSDWWVWNQIPVTLGNFAGGFLFTGLALYLTHKPKTIAKTVEAAGEAILAK